MEDASTRTNPDGSPDKNCSSYTESRDGATPQHWYVFVSEKVGHHWEWEICCDTGENSISTDYGDEGVAYLGELTLAQFRLVLQEFHRLNNVEEYRVSFRTPPHLGIETEESVKVLMGNYKILSTGQQKILDIAVHTANNVRGVNGCGSKNITPKMSRQLPKENKQNKVATTRRKKGILPKDLDNGIVQFFYYKLTGDEKTREQIEEKLKLGQGTLSGKYAKPLMEEMATMTQASPQSGDFARWSGEINLDTFHKVLYKFLKTTLKEAKKNIVVKGMQSTKKTEKGRS